MGAPLRYLALTEPVVRLPDGKVSLIGVSLSFVEGEMTKGRIECEKKNYGWLPVSQ